MPSMPLVDADPTVSDAVAVRQSPIHGVGLFATRTIQAGHAIGSYAGSRHRGDEQSIWQHAVTYLFRLSDGTLIDGRVGGNATRHINHSCEPNCEAFETEVEDGLPAIVIEATRPIASGEELFLDYALDVDEADVTRYGCRCGTSGCRGTMVGG